MGPEYRTPYHSWFPHRASIGMAKLSWSTAAKLFWLLDVGRPFWTKELKQTKSCHGWQRCSCRQLGKQTIGPKLAHSTSFSIAIDGKALNRVSEYTCRGVVLDASLAWNVHIDYLISKVKK